MTLSLGKQRCLQQISNEKGIICTVALDHRDAYVAMLAAATGTEPTWADVAEEKVRMTRAWVPHVTAVLLDPIYSAGPAIRQNAIPGSVGLMIAREKSGYSPSNQGRVTTLLEGWSSGKIRRLGGTAVKLLLHYHPEAPNAAQQEAVVCQVADECAQADIPFLLEPICYPLDPQLKKSDAAFAQERPFLVIESARKLSRLGADVMKLEFPTDANHETDEQIMRDGCHQISAAIEIPWVLLSAGVDFDQFRQQVRLACAAGASGYVAGRAIWKEGLQLKNVAERERFYGGTAVERLQALTFIANQFATPLWEAMPEASISDLKPDWHLQIA
jgi:tagatose 1,6-diphosphate aldolase